MTGDRFVALGLARPRASWFVDVARWSTAGAVPLEFTKCVSPDELRTRLSSGRPFSVILVDEHLLGVDRDLIDLARSCDAPVIVVTGEPPLRDWLALGAAAILPDHLARDDLVRAVTGHGRPLTSTVRRPSTDRSATTAGEWRGRLVGVTGSGGVGTSTVAMALTQGLARDPRHGGHVLLADACLDADLALLHDVGDVVPGLPELVDAHRLGVPTGAEVESLTYALDRGYSLLLGLRRHRDWTTLRPRAVEAAFDTLVSTFRIVVADTDDDTEGQKECGSVDVEERNVLARTSLNRADVVLAVGTPGVKGLHDLARLVDGLTVDADESPTVVPVLNRAPRHPGVRAETTRALARLLADNPNASRLPSPINLVERRRVEQAIRDGRPLPSVLCDPLAGAVTGVLAGIPISAHGDAAPIEPGALGSRAATA